MQDIAALETNFNPDQLERIALDIERLRTQTIFELGARLAEAHELFKYKRDEGGFGGWVEVRLGISRSSAYSLLDVHARFGNGESVQNLDTLPKSAVFLLAAPSTPPEVIEEVGKRAESGEKLKYKDVLVAVTGTRKKKKLEDGNDVDPQTSADEAKAQHAACDGNSAERADDATGGAHDGGSDDIVAGAPAPKTSPKSKSKKLSLLESWEASEEDRETIRGLVLDAYFAGASGVKVLRRIRNGRADLLRDVLDALGVDTMLGTMSPDFGAALRARMPAKKPRPDPKYKDIKLSPNPPASPGTPSRH